MQTVALSRSAMPQNPSGFFNPPAVTGYTSRLAQERQQNNQFVTLLNASNLIASHASCISTRGQLCL